MSCLYISLMPLCDLTTIRKGSITPVESKAYIPPGVSFALCLQLSATQMKCPCNANDFTYILYDFFVIKIR